ncbi:LysE family translocator [Shewanella litorisediminis]|uniref:LysE family translocator n=1 Tax=Shewanella litorisediminis TaxID=1173586 RepID=A0ABX7G2N9_9GAMM|nr:LysE family translocator [Shewanella litorisediminis]MCL2917032.1 LysE family translocator [Shewanella litorisediminis]QRH01513.1 LysE family translocator [Shewanella litorisediminis]
MFEALSLLAIATVLLLGSPGPAPLTLAALGAAQGFRRSLPFLGGLIAGLLLIMLAAASGLASLLQSFPVLVSTLKWLAAAYILYLAFRIATAPLVMVDSDNAVGFRNGLLFNLMNPKAYMALLSLLSQFALPLGSPLASYALTIAVCLLLATLVDVLWLALGKLAGSKLLSPKQIIWLKRLMALGILVALLVSLAQGMPRFSQ